MVNELITAVNRGIVRAFLTMPISITRTYPASSSFARHLRKIGFFAIIGRELGRHWQKALFNSRSGEEDTQPRLEKSSVSDGQ